MYLTLVRLKQLKIRDLKSWRVKVYKFYKYLNVCKMFSDLSSFILLS